jgi:voltage-gated potassium channel
MNLRDQLISFGLQLPDGFSIDQWAAKLGEQPCRNTAALVAASAVLFYAAEKNRNPKVNDVWDAAVYTSTCLSVGYGDIFARTPFGKIIGTTLMTLGPSLSSRALDGPAAPDATQEQILVTLKQILEKLNANAESPQMNTDEHR